MDENFAKIDAHHQAWLSDPNSWPEFLRRVAAGETPRAVWRSLEIQPLALTLTDEQRQQLAIAEGERSLAIRERIEEELQSIAFLDARTLFTANHRLKPVDQWPAQLGAAVAGIDWEELFDLVDREDGERGKEKALIGYLKKMKMWDKLKAIDMLGKQHGMFKDKSGAADRIADSLEAMLARTWVKAKVVEVRALEAKS
jgi:hypothetical protein